MSKEVNLMNEVKTNGGFFVKGEYCYTTNTCEDCEQSFVLESHNNPMFDDARVIEFPHICDDCL